MPLQSGYGRGCGEAPAATLLFSDSFTSFQKVLRAPMPKLIPRAKLIPAAGTKPKRIEEFFGRANSGEGSVSIARMQSPGGWIEPGQTPEFDEYTVVLEGVLRVESKAGVLDVRAGQAVLVQCGEWVRYSTPEPEGAQYVAVCLPAFSLESAHRDAP